MDDQDRATRLTKAALTGCGLLVLTAIAHSTLGDFAGQVVLLGALLALMVFAYGELSGRPVPGLARLRRDDAAVTSAGPDTWRSERWIAEAVERGLRALDEWRWEQRSA